MPYFPITLNLSGRQCLVVGGGRVAERKTKALLSYQAKVKVVSPRANKGLKILAKEGVIQYCQREYRSSDLEDVFLVIGASDKQEVNSRIGREAKAKGILVNIVDNPEISNFFTVASIRRGDLQITVSTGGKFPGLARKIREELEEQFGSEYEHYLDLLGKIREEIKAQVSLPEERKKALSRALKLDLLQKLGEGKSLNPGEIVETLLARK